jgi:very-short-patch-repair endonuclease
MNILFEYSKIILSIMGFIVFLFLIIGAFLYVKFPGIFSQEGRVSGKIKKEYYYARKQFFMSRAENSFYKGLVQAVGNEYAIFAQVHLPTIVDEKIQGQDWLAARTRIDRKSVDFVLCDKEYLHPKLVIELDDATHERPDRQERDRFVESVLVMAKLPILRIKYSENLNSIQLGERIKEKLSIVS